MRISNPELRMANLVGSRIAQSLELGRFAIFLLLLFVVPVVAQTSATKAPNKVTVTLVRWPYT